MSNNVKNTFILGCALLAFVISLVYYEIEKSEGLIELAEDPALSIQRGNVDAIADFGGKFRSFKEVYIDGSGWVVPGEPETDLAGRFKDYDPRNRFMCVWMHPVQEMALKIRQYEYNEHYVVAYNIRLSSLLYGEKI